MTHYPVRYFSLSPEIVEVHWPDRIEEGILFDILAFEKMIVDHWSDKIRSIHHGYHILGIELNEALPAKHCVESLRQLRKRQNSSYLVKPMEWRLPVCYDLDLVPELETYLKKKGLSHPSFVKKHTAPAYLLYFYGFLPGFMYLGGLDKDLHVPRKSRPDRKIEKGSVAIGGGQTGIYPMASPGGWYQVGASPVEFFQEGKLKLPFRPGDRIRFEAIGQDAYSRIREKQSFEWESKAYEG
ncbi:inhibitor of KinA [Cyclobacterium lianum]|uniref:Inhibitor of KinA n=1 Tax=Cyclobacterium lianum TaxID=388280 RepID=A0A1M7QI62_9BACT|nr:carboxyltransferase domain-containing protein [Cyclobacterium lianum]SHN30844.1 inhibitor of KinA [Cyclobacterium lianum]